jgi:hypothetical protein
VGNDAVPVHVGESLAVWVLQIHDACSRKKPRTITTSTGVLVFTRAGDSGAEWEIVPNASQSQAGAPACARATV